MMDDNAIDTTAEATDRADQAALDALGDINLPWSIIEGVFIHDREGHQLASLFHGTVNLRYEKLTSHIVACVNACAGINPKAVPDLLAALVSCVYCLENDGYGGSYVADVARAAIAKAKGE